MFCFSSSCFLFISQFCILFQYQFNSFTSSFPSLFYYHNSPHTHKHTQCSVQCGTGTRQKEMHCARVYKPEIKGTPRRREFIDPSYCRHLRVPKPKRTHKPCKVSCKWSVSNWSQCPEDCSEEYQSRSVYCESIVGNPISHVYCDASKKPPEKKICNNCVTREYNTLSKVRYTFILVLYLS